MYSFWDYLPGIIVFGLLGIGFFGAILIQIIVGISAVFFTTIGVRETSQDNYMMVKVNAYDEDEDR